MVLRLPDKWVWDFWPVRHNEQYHLFYLQAPRALGDPNPASLERDDRARDVDRLPRLADPAGRYRTGCRGELGRPHDVDR